MGVRTDSITVGTRGSIEEIEHHAISQVILAVHEPDPVRQPGLSLTYLIVEWTPSGQRSGFIKSVISQIDRARFLLWYDRPVVKRGISDDELNLL